MRELKHKNVIDRGSAYQVHITYRDGGERKQYSRSFKKNYFATDEEAFNAACECEEQFILNKKKKRVTNTTATVGGLYQESLSFYQNSVKTKARHNNLYNKAIKQFENKKIDIITLSDIQSTLNSHVEDFSDDQLARIKSLWVRIYHIALISGCMVEDIPSMVQVPKSKKPATAKREEVTVETIEKMSDAITNYSTKHCSSKQIANRSTILYIFQLMRYTGMRPAEACALTVKDFNFNNKTISINKAVGSTNTDTECIIATKTATSVRNIPMSSECEKWAHDAILIHNMNISMGVKKNTDYVLARADGTLWDIDALCSQIRMIAIKNKLNFSLYDLRHKFASDLVNAGTPLSVIRDLMGHSNVAMSLSYSRSSEKDRHEAIDKIR